MKLRSCSFICILRFAVGLVLAGTLTGWANSAPAIGILTCDVSEGIRQSMICDFHRPDEPVEAYSGIIDEFDSTIDANEDEHLSWAVFAKGLHVGPGGLSGEYARVGEDLLVGGQKKALTLRPLSPDGSEGINLAFRVIKVSLVATN